jgi:hypothetical protein
MNSKILTILLIFIFIIVTSIKPSIEDTSTTKIDQTTRLFKTIKSNRIVTPLMTTKLEFNPFGIGFKPIRTTTLQLIIFNNYEINRIK